MKLKSAGSRSPGSKETEMNEQIQEAVTDAITKSNDKTIEIRPADESRGRGKLGLIALIGAVAAVGYWLRSSGQSPDALQDVASETAERTKQMTEQAADTIQEGGETVADRVEEGSQKAGEQVQQTGERAAEGTEEASETVAEKVDESDSSASS